MTRWSARQVAELAPDPPSLAAARKLARPGPWSEAGSTDTLLWGKCQGSGRTPYQVSVDLIAPAFRCSCPSRKFPCKHGLALLMLWVDGAGSVAEVDHPADFARDWAGERSARDAAKSEPGMAKAADPAAAAKRLQRRLELMNDGMDDFGRWLRDFARTGMAAARAQPYGWWDGTAARLVDAQLPGLGEDVRTIGGAVLSGGGSRADWTERLLGALGRWWLTTRAWASRESMDADQLGDLRAYLGWAVSSESVRSEAVGRQAAITDRWLVLGAHQSDDGKLAQQRTWLRGTRSAVTVQVLDFAAGGQVLPVARTIGSTLDATVALYPGRGVRRALFLDEPAVSEPAVVESAVDAEPAPLPEAVSVTAARRSFVELSAANPWTVRAPVVLAEVTLGMDDAGAGLAHVDSGVALSVSADVDLWSWLAATGGSPRSVFGELEASGFRPLAAVIDHAWVSV